MNSNFQDSLTKFECPICQCIYTNPHSILTCNHVFCKECIDSLMQFPTRDSSFQCPLCKSDFAKRDLKADKQLRSEIKSTTAVCKCDLEIKLSDWNEHISDCRAYQDEIAKDIKSTVVKEAKKTVNRSTFNCSVCDKKNLDRETLLKHVERSHRKAQAVCPICVCQPWGDANYITHLFGHLEKRHKFEYETTVDYNEEEEEVLKKVLMESLKDK